MLGLLQVAVLALLSAEAQAMKLDFKFPRFGQRDQPVEHALHKRAPTYITNFTLPDTNYTYVHVPCFLPHSLSLSLSLSCPFVVSSRTPSTLPTHVQ
jgi:hypothetical protein